MDGFLAPPHDLHPSFIPPLKELLRPFAVPGPPTLTVINPGEFRGANSLQHSRYSMAHLTPNGYLCFFSQQLIPAVQRDDTAPLNEIANNGAARCFIDFDLKLDRAPSATAFEDWMQIIDLFAHQLLHTMQVHWFGADRRCDNLPGPLRAFVLGEGKARRVIKDGVECIKISAHIHNPDVLYDHPALYNAAIDMALRQMPNQYHGKALHDAMDRSPINNMQLRVAFTARTPNGEGILTPLHEYAEFSGSNPDWSLLSINVSEPQLLDVASNERHFLRPRTRFAFDALGCSIGPSVSQRNHDDDDAEPVADNPQQYVSTIWSKSEVRETLQAASIIDSSNNSNNIVVALHKIAVVELDANNAADRFRCRNNVDHEHDGRREKALLVRTKDAASISVLCESCCRVHRAVVIASLLPVSSSATELDQVEDQLKRLCSKTNNPLYEEPHVATSFASVAIESLITRAPLAGRTVHADDIKALSLRSALMFMAGEKNVPRERINFSHELLVRDGGRYLETTRNGTEVADTISNASSVTASLNLADANARSTKVVKEIRTGTGTGKTTAIHNERRAIRAVLGARSRMLFISPRVLLCETLYAEMTAHGEATWLYSDSQAPAGGAFNYITCVNSLCKALDTSDQLKPEFANFDTVMIDEIEEVVHSLLLSETMTSLNRFGRLSAMRVLRLVVERAKFVIGLSADLSAVSHAVIAESLLGALLDGQRLMLGRALRVHHIEVVHRWQPPEPPSHTAVVFKHRSTLIEEVLTRLGRNERLAVFCANKGFGSQLQALILERFPGKRVVFADAEFRQSRDGQRLSENPSQFCVDEVVDVLIYTTAFGIGFDLSFDEQAYFHCVALFYGKHVGPNGALQALDRTRKLRVDDDCIDEQHDNDECDDDNDDDDLEMVNILKAMRSSSADGRVGAEATSRTVLLYFPERRRSDDELRRLPLTTIGDSIIQARVKRLGNDVSPKKHVAWVLANQTSEFSMQFEVAHSIAVAQKRVGWEYGRNIVESNLRSKGYTITDNVDEPAQLSKAACNKPSIQVDQETIDLVNRLAYHDVDESVQLQLGLVIKEHFDKPTRIRIFSLVQILYGNEQQQQSTTENYCARSLTERSYPHAMVSGRNIAGYGHTKLATIAANVFRILGLRDPYRGGAAGRREASLLVHLIQVANVTHVPNPTDSARLIAVDRFLRDYCSFGKVGWHTRTGEDVPQGIPSYRIPLEPSKRKTAAMRRIDSIAAFGKQFLNWYFHDEYFVERAMLNSERLRFMAPLVVRLAAHEHCSLPSEFISSWGGNDRDPWLTTVSVDEMPLMARHAGFVKYTLDKEKEQKNAAKEQKKAAKRSATDALTVVAPAATVTTTTESRAVKRPRLINSNLSDLMSGGTGNLRASRTPSVLPTQRSAVVPRRGDITLEGVAAPLVLQAPAAVAVAATIPTTTAVSSSTEEARVVKRPRFINSGSSGLMSGGAGASRTLSVLPLMLAGIAAPNADERAQIDLLLRSNVADETPLLSFDNVGDICAMDIRRLRPVKFLNDQIINAFTGTLRSEAAAMRAIIGETFDVGFNLLPTMVDRLLGQRGRLRDLKYSVNDGSVRYLCLPVNLVEQHHWSLCVVDFVDEALLYYDPLDPAAAAVPEFVTTAVCNLVTSLHGSGVRFKNAAARSWSRSPLQGAPLQRDGVSCGVFVCAAISALVHNASFIDAQHVDAFRSHIAARLLRCGRRLGTTLMQSAATLAPSQSLQSQPPLSPPPLALHPTRSAMVPHRGDIILDWVLGDGNCYWRAIVKQLNGGGATASDAAYAEVRAAVVQYALVHNDTEHWELAACVPDYYFVTQDPVTHVESRASDDVRRAEWRRLCAAISVDRAWNDPLFDWLVPQLTARALRRNIRIYQEQVDVPPIVAEMEPADVADIAAAAQRPTLEIFRAHDHYWSVRAEDIRDSQHLNGGTPEQFGRTTTTPMLAPLATPLVLQSSPTATVRFVPCEQQTGNKCGNHAVANAVGALGGDRAAIRAVEDENLTSRDVEDLIHTSATVADRIFVVDSLDLLQSANASFRDIDSALLLQRLRQSGSVSLVVNTAEGTLNHRRDAHWIAVTIRASDRVDTVEIRDSLNRDDVFERARGPVKEFVRELMMASALEQPTTSPSMQLDVETTHSLQTHPLAASAGDAKSNGA
jgi:hypothetical protein